MLRTAVMRGANWIVILLALPLSGGCVTGIEPGDDPGLVDLEASGGDLPPGWQICIWEHTGFEGARTCWAGLPSGEYWLPILIGYQVGNDMMSSLALNSGAAVIVFEHINHDGRVFGLAAAPPPFPAQWYPDLLDTPVGNDGASSIILQIE